MEFQVTFLEMPIVGKSCRIRYNGQDGVSSTLTSVTPSAGTPGRYCAISADDRVMIGNYTVAIKPKTGLASVHWVVWIVVGIVLLAGAINAIDAMSEYNSATDRWKQTVGNNQSVDDEITKAQATLKQYMYSNFGGGGYPEAQVSWYANMKQIELSPSSTEGQYSVRVVTDIYNDSDAIEPSRAMATAILNCSEIEVHDVGIYGKPDDSVLCHFYR